EPSFAGLTILVVDDDKNSRTLLSEVLRACDAIVLEADNIPRAKAYVSMHKLHLVVTDLSFPREDGITFLGWLRQQPRHEARRIPAIVVTARYEEYPPAEVSGWTAYFEKPVDMNQFVETVAAILKVPRDPNFGTQNRSGSRQAPTRGDRRPVAACLANRTVEMPAA